MKKVDIIIDLQYGSTGKGLIAGYMAMTGYYDMVINANMPNAGHTFIDAHGNKMMHKVLPNGVVGHTVKDVMIGPGSIFSVERLMEELTTLNGMGYNDFRLWIHENAVVLLDTHKIAESSDKVLNDIGSTQQGTAAAMIQKIMRNGVRDITAGAQLSKEPFFKGKIITQREWLMMINAASEILVEGAQGYSLGMNAGFYPFCTSRDCTPTRFLADCGVSHHYLRRVIGTARLHPIRVGGTSGPCYSDQEEITWDSIGQEPELTTVTNRERRVYTWSNMQIEEAIMACHPNHIFLNFCNYAPDDVSKRITDIRSAGMKCGFTTDVIYTGYGPTVNDVNAKLLDPCDMTRQEFMRGNH